MKNLKLFESWIHFLKEEQQNSFFNSDSDRELWIRLNAQRQVEWEKNLKYFDRKSKTYKPTLQALNPRTMEEALEISRRQLEYDERVGKLRFSLEELSSLSFKELDKIQQQNHQNLAQFQSHKILWEKV